MKINLPILKFPMTRNEIGVLCKSKAKFQVQRRTSKPSVEIKMNQISWYLPHWNVWRNNEFQSDFPRKCLWQIDESSSIWIFKEFFFYQLHRNGRQCIVSGPVLFLQVSTLFTLYVVSAIRVQTSPEVHPPREKFFNQFVVKYLNLPAVC